MSNRISEINSEIEALNQELKTQQEYNELLENVKSGKPDFGEFMKLVIKFVSQYDSKIPISEGAVQEIKIKRWDKEWVVGFTMVDSHFGLTIYDIDARLMNINERISERVTDRQNTLNKRAKRNQEELEEVENTDLEIQKDWNELEEQIKTWQAGGKQ